MRGQDQQSRLFYDLCTIVLSILRSPQSHLHFSIPLFAMPSLDSSSPRRTTSTPEVSRARVASLLLGISLALMLCGSVTFLVGFILMPWILVLVMVLYLFGIVSNLSALGRAILCPIASPTIQRRKEISGQLLSKLPII